MAKSEEWMDSQVLFKAAMRDAYTELTKSKDPLWIEADEPTKKHLVRMVAENKMVALGYVPSSWRFIGNCRRCGEVPLETKTEVELVACPWCAVGAKPSVYSYV